MRLTLRTLLAYMDGILEPEQAEQLRKKIEDSEFAKNLMERIREVTRRLRLGAPSLGEKAALLDPNTVAEYLDNTLHGDKVPDFEKVCLESDIALAEVASCHQILAMILGEPAEIDPVTRQKMYQLLAQAATKGEESRAGEAGAGGAREAQAEKAAGEEPSRSPARPAVPEYLRDEPKGRRRFWLAAALLFLAGFITMILLGSLGLVGPGGPLGWLWVGPAQEQGPSEPSEPSPPGQPGTPQPEQPSAKLSQPKEVAPRPKEEAGQPPGEKLPQAPLPEDLQKTSPSEPGKEKPTPPSEKPVETPKTDIPSQTPPVAPTPPETKPEEKTMPSEPQPTQPAPEAPQLLGQLVSDREVLLRSDPMQRDWWRIAPQGNVQSGERLLALPTFRPVIGLVPGITATLIGPTEVELLPGSAELPSGMTILFGKVRLSRVGPNPVAFRIQVEGVTGTLSLLDPDATVAIAVGRGHIPGNDPMRMPDPVRMEVYAARGRVGFALGGIPAVELASPSRLPLEMLCTGTDCIGAAGHRTWKITPGQIESLPKPPDWITTDTSTLLERQAAAEVEQRLPPDRLARIGLMELLEHRRSEVQAFASRCLGYLGEYHQLVSLLNKAEERAAWFEALELLQEAVAWSSESASGVRQALEKQYGPQNSVMLYRMLLGYSESQLMGGEAAALVDMLEHNDLVFRVMSWWNLQKLTGKTFSYQPDAPKTKRDPAVKRWRDWLAQLSAGKITLSKESPGPKEKESPAPKAKEAAGSAKVLPQPEPGFQPAQPPPAPPPPRPENPPPFLPAPPPEIPMERKTLPEPSPAIPEAPPAEKRP